MCRVGLPDYVLVFRTPGENPIPIENANMDVETWQKYASPVWYDIDYGNTLQGNTKGAGGDEKHICPLQLDTIKRAIILWSNPGEIVFSPFAGIGSELYTALELGRKALGIELKETYFEMMKTNLNQMEVIKNQQELF